MAGVPFDVVEQLATLRTSAFAGKLVVRREEFVGYASQVDRFLQSHGRELSKELFRAWKKAIRGGSLPPSQPLLDVFEKCRECQREISELEARLYVCIHQELNQ